MQHQFCPEPDTLSYRLQASQSPKSSSKSSLHKWMDGWMDRQIPDHIYSLLPNHVWTGLCFTFYLNHSPIKSLLHTQLTRLNHSYPAIFDAILAGKSFTDLRPFLPLGWLNAPSLKFFHQAHLGHFTFTVSTHNSETIYVSSLLLGKKFL